MKIGFCRYIILFTFLLYASSNLNAEVSDSLSLKPDKPYSFGGYTRYLFDGFCPKDTTNVRTIPALAFGVSLITAMVITHYRLYNFWWKTSYGGGFHWQNDWEDSRQFDKFGHFYATYMLAFGASEVLMYSGINRNTAEWLGMCFGFAYQLYIETNDGFAAPFGFSPTDIAANFLGASFFILQRKYEFLQYFTPKWQYIPAKWMGGRTSGTVISFFDTYNTSSFWLSADVHNLLPENVKNCCPPWLNLALGYSVRGFELSNPQRCYMVGLDLNFPAIAENMKPSTWRWLVQSLNYLKFPLPAVEFGYNRKIHLFYPFAFGIVKSF